MVSRRFSFYRVVRRWCVLHCMSAGLPVTSYLYRGGAGLFRLRGTQSGALGNGRGVRVGREKRCVSTAMAPKFTLTYFDIEGAGEPIRLAANLGGIEFEDKRVTRPEWAEMKAKMPNKQIPVMTLPGSDRLYTQSTAILQHVAKMAQDKLAPAPENEFDVDEALALAEDCRLAFSPSFYMGMAPDKFGHPQGFQSTPEGKQLIQDMRTKFVSDALPGLLDSITILLDRHGGDAFLAGPKPTIADCKIFVWLRGFTRGHIDHVPTNCLETHPKVVAYMHRFAALPGVSGRYTDGIRHPM